MILSYKLFEAYKKSITKEFVEEIAKKHQYKVLKMDPVTDYLGADLKVEFTGDEESDGSNEYDSFIDELIKEIGDDLSEIYTEETGYHFKIYLKSPINEKVVQQTIFTRSYLEEFLKPYGFTLNAYVPMLNELSIKVLIVGDKSKYERMIDRLISLHYREVREVNTLKEGEEFKIFIKEL